jgi:NAD(P)-dependent dehydrogenase (short-subunit alcohol dehydrogenase family)
MPSSNSNWSAADIPDLSGKTAIVTGANSGIGLETARELARKGASVVLACRNEKKGAAALDDIRKADTSARITLAALDLADLASIAEFAREFSASHERLDILCNNGGVMVPPLGWTRDGFETQFGTNHLGHFALTGQLIAKILAQPGARVVNVSSTAHRTGKIDFDNLDGKKSYSAIAFYGQSKLANLLFTRELQKRLKARGADALAAAAHPGWTATNLQDNAPVFRMLNPLFSQAPPDGALPTLYAATAEGVEGGGYYGPSRMFEMWGSPKPAVKSARAQDDEVAARLWSLSEELTGVSFAL